jgi:hypothetical protein
VTPEELELSGGRTVLVAERTVEVEDRLSFSCNRLNIFGLRGQLMFQLLIYAIVLVVVSSAHLHDIPPPHRFSGYLSSSFPYLVDR